MMRVEDEWRLSKTEIPNEIFEPKDQNPVCIMVTIPRSHVHDTNCNFIKCGKLQIV